MTQEYHDDIVRFINSRKTLVKFLPELEYTHNLDNKTWVWPRASRFIAWAGDGDDIAGYKRAIVKQHRRFCDNGYHRNYIVLPMNRSPDHGGRLYACIRRGNWIPLLTQESLREAIHQHHNNGLEVNDPQNPHRTDDELLRYIDQHFHIQHHLGDTRKEIRSYLTHCWHCYDAATPRLRDRKIILLTALMRSRAKTSLEMLRYGRVPFFSHPTLIR